MSDLNSRIARENWERLCEWMEPKPTSAVGSQDACIDLVRARWWVPSLNRKTGSWGWEPRLQTLDACAIAEAEIKKRGLMREYAKQLLLAFPSDGTKRTWEWGVFLICITPAQRCAAMIAAVSQSPA